MIGMQIFMCYVGEINGSNTLHYLLLNKEISKISFNQLLVLYDLFCFGLLLFVQKYSSCCASHIACRIRSKLLVRHSKAFQDLIPIGLFLSITQNTLCWGKQGSCPLCDHAQGLAAFTLFFFLPGMFTLHHQCEKQVVSELGLGFWFPMLFMLSGVQGSETGEGYVVRACSCPKKVDRHMVIEVFASFCIWLLCLPCLSHAALVSRPLYI